MTIEKLNANDHTAREKRRPSCFRVLVCYSSPCRAAGAEAVFESLVQTVNTLHLNFEVKVNATGCTARCTDGPLVRVCIPGMKDVVYTNVTPECIIGILKEHIPGLAGPE
jgi:bidirectional [NiFe] hydrogenase diaphorase subunit